MAHGCAVYEPKDGDRHTLYIVTIVSRYNESFKILFKYEAMNFITVEHHVTPAKLDVLYVDDWPLWEKGVSEFDWTYDKKETCYIVEGKAVIIPENEEAITIQEGDMVFFPKGMKCVWKIIEPIEKHYLIED